MTQESSFTVRTKSILAKIVSKTPLSDKLLSKPPFRYLHDLISEVIRSGNEKFAGIFTEEELDSGNYKVRYTLKTIKDKVVANSSTVLTTRRKILS